MTPLDFLVLVLAVWRLAHLLAFEEGPWRIFERLRRLAGQRIGADGVLYNATHLADGVTCLWCNSMWFGIAFTVLWATCGKITLMVAAPFALSAAAIVLDSGVEALLRGIREWQ